MTDEKECDLCKEKREERCRQRQGMATAESPGQEFGALQSRIKARVARAGGKVWIR